jgi:hypothetical protein
MWTVATLEMGKIGIFIAEQAAPAPHLAHPGGYAASNIVLVTVPREPLLRAFCS